MSASEEPSSSKIPGLDVDPESVERRREASSDFFEGRVLDLTKPPSPPHKVISTNESVSDTD